MTPSLQGTPELRQLTGMALPGTSAAGKCFVRNCGGHGATPAAHQGESISCCLKDSDLDAAKMAEQEYAGLVAFQDR